jgi:hypothetical protein
MKRRFNYKLDCTYIVTIVLSYALIIYIHHILN